MATLDEWTAQVTAALGIPPDALDRDRYSTWPGIRPTAWSARRHRSPPTWPASPSAAAPSPTTSTPPSARCSRHRRLERRGNLTR